MARPCKKRTVCLKLKAGYFRPEEFPEPGSAEVVLEVDEIESVRLADLVGEYQVAAARKMGVSRSTFSNIINRAHQKIAEALIRGRAIRINCPRLVKKMQRMGVKNG
ncbi:MAG: DUF134 domain-containing protein [Candidatus Omnitrophota bacterium]